MDHPLSRLSRKNRLVRRPIGRYIEGEMLFNATVNPVSEHELYLKLFITNGGGW